MNGKLYFLNVIFIKMLIKTSFVSFCVCVYDVNQNECSDFKNVG